MKHIAALVIALISLTFFIGANCDSGDFQTSYFFCCDALDSTCSTDPTQCPANGCTTGQQTFTNGQNECNILQLDAANNTCALTQRVNWYIAIGCSGQFAENPQMNPPINLVVTPGPARSASITLTWNAPPGAIGPFTYTILRAQSSAAEGVYAQGVVGTGYTDDATSPSPPISGQPYYYEVSATNIGGTSGNSLEVTVVAP